MVPRSIPCPDRTFQVTLKLVFERILHLPVIGSSQGGIYEPYHLLLCFTFPADYHRGMCTTILWFVYKLQTNITSAFKNGQ